MALTRVLPVIDLRAALLNERVDGLEAVRRLQRPAQHAVHPEAMQRQGLVEAFRQTAGRRLVPILQLMLERLEGGEGLVVLRTVVGALETLPPENVVSYLAKSEQPVSPMTYEDALNIYTDGSMYSRPRTGGLGIRIVTFDASGTEEIEDYPVLGYKGATNNSMELHACVLALRFGSKHPRLGEVARICIFTDSRYVVDNHKKAMFQWPRQKWLTAQGTPVLNADIWKKLVREIQKIRRRVDFQWVKGHSRDVHNRAVDKMAKESAKSVSHAPLSVVAVRRKQTAKSVELGSVEMRKQRLMIRVITSEWLKVQKTSR